MARKQPNREMVPVPAATVAPVEERIRARAYEIWLRNGCQDGRETEDWIEAERELMQETAASTAAA